MRDIYRRLSALGIDAPFIRDRILPEWWSDSEASVPATRAMAEFAISRFLGIPIAALRDRTATLSLPALGPARLKLRKDVTRKKVVAGLALAQRTAHLIVALLQSRRTEQQLPAFARVKVADVRNWIRSRGRRVTLAALLDFAWAHGVVVLHLPGMPRGNRTFDGMACFVGNVPVVVLASARQGPPWIAFHLAHELGHLMLAHTTPGGESIVDAGLEGKSTDPQEREADNFAMQVLTGTTSPPVPSKSLKAPRLVSWAREVGDRTDIDPGTLSLIVGRLLNRLPAAQIALRMMALDVGAHAITSKALERALGDNLPEDLTRLLTAEADMP